ncbi:hypothetical protein [Moheibacter lacus]|uniref:Uncharacterized protein n=1 Tax=Moheibacter lacus TaxID=2745851 RepID=A0A838ZP12_9FLAO|nr:hypothetical protein [Moheibacter lacus]MBA5629067.1 hypothetical protein [Moheibacter lacus]
MKIKSFIQLVLGFVFVIWSCKNETTFQGKHDPDVIKTYRNHSTPVSKMDSIASINFITKQKLTELYELSSLYSSNSEDSILQEILFPQIKSYFLENDSITPFQILNELDSLAVYYVEVGDLKLSEKDSIRPDSLKIVQFDVKFFSKDKKLIDSKPKTATYILKKEPKQFKHEFIFYFSELNDIQEVANDTISSGVAE